MDVDLIFKIAAVGIVVAVLLFILMLMGFLVKCSEMLLLSRSGFV